MKLTNTNFNLFLILLISSIGAQSQTWRSTLYPSNWVPPTTSDFYTDAFIQDYSYAGYRAGEVAIPTITNNIKDVTQAPYNADNTGTNDATLAIQTAINDAGNEGGGVVYLPAGTFKILLPAGQTNCLRIQKSNIILRGAGVGQTFIYNATTAMNGKSIISINSNSANIYSEGANVSRITTDLNNPTTIIPVVAASNFKVGDVVVVRFTISNAWCVEHKETDWQNYSNTLRGVSHVRTVKAVNTVSNTITIDAPTRYTLKTRDDARVYLAPAFLTEVGLEDFSIANKEIVTNQAEWLDPGSTTNLDDNAHTSSTKGAFNCENSWVINVREALNSWINNVSTYKPANALFNTQILSNGILLDQCRNVTLDNVFIGFSQYGGGSGNGYGIRIQSNDCLIKNSRIEAMRHGYVFSFMHSHGNVIFNSTDTNTGKCTANGPGLVNTGSSTSDFHMHFSPSNLIDKCTFDRSSYSALHRRTVGSAPTHNAVTAHTTFWNTIGNNSPGSYVIRTSQTRYGYIIGTSGNTNAVNYRVAQAGPAHRYDTDGSRTAPEDIVEGQGTGATLEPQSLYLDQLSKRLATLSNNESSIFNQSSLLLYPNPIAKDGVLNIQTKSNNNPIEIFDSLGKKVLSREQSGESTSIQLNGFQSGTYILKVGTQSAKFIVK